MIFKPSFLGKNFLQELYITWHVSSLAKGMLMYILLKTSKDSKNVLSSLLILSFWGKETNGLCWGYNYLYLGLFSSTTFSSTRASIIFSLFSCSFLGGSSNCLPLLKVIIFTYSSGFILGYWARFLEFYWTTDLIDCPSIPLDFL